MPSVSSKLHHRLFHWEKSCSEGNPEPPHRSLWMKSPSSFLKPTLWEAESIAPALVDVTPPFSAFSYMWSVSISIVPLPSVCKHSVILLVWKVTEIKMPSPASDPLFVIAWGSRRASLHASELALGRRTKARLLLGCWPLQPLLFHWVPAIWSHSPCSALSTFIPAEPLMGTLSLCCLPPYPSLPSSPLPGRLPCTLQALV